uniref:U18-Nephitoxin-Nsp1ab_1 n=1 Tax=Nephila sp. SGP-2016 TaxID=1905176 RepID=A0A4Q8K4R3_9ARAC
MMKIVALLVLIVLATPASAQDFQEFFEDVHRPGMQGNRLHHVRHASLPQDVRSMLELPNFVGENRTHQMWNFVNSSLIVFPEV